jgi:hypothetical protein
VRWRIVLNCVCLALSCVSAGRAGDTNTDHASLTQVQATYLERCGGCHGIQGRSSPDLVPDLRDQVGHFLCLPEGRAYLVRLPSIATSPLTDQEVAELMNFVVFDLGRTKAIAGKYPAYSAEEVRQLRAQPLNAVALASYRAEIVEQLISRCEAPATLRDYLR